MNNSSQIRYRAVFTVAGVFADELRRAREEAELTQESLATKAKVTREYVSHLERGKREPSLSVFVRLCKALEVHPPAMLERILRPPAK